VGSGVDNDRREALWISRLLHKARSPELQRAHTMSNSSMSCYNDDAARRVKGPHTRNELKAALYALPLTETEIDNNNTGAMTPKKRESAVDT
jgi:hypothetical protein